MSRAVIVLQPGATVEYDANAWHTALATVEQGALELECSNGERHLFGRGAVLCLRGLPLRALHHAGREPTVLAVVTRQQEATRADPARARWT